MKIQPETVIRIKELADGELILRYLGFHIFRKTSKELRGPCKIHGGDNPTAFRFNLETKTWSCYTRHCEEEGHRDLVGLVQKTTGQNFVESVRILATLTGIDLEDQSRIPDAYLKIKQRREMDAEIERAKLHSTEKKFFPEEVVQDFIPNRTDYFLQRGFPLELLDFFQVGGMKDRYGVHRETIPIRDENGNLLTVSARRTDSDEDPKYLLLKDIKKTDTLYNLDIAKNCVGFPRTLILVEGFVDVWTLALHGIWNVVAAMGTFITPQQARLIHKYAEDVIVMLDPDKAGQHASEKVRELLMFYTGVEVKKLDKDPKYLEYCDIVKIFGGKRNND